MEINLPNLEEIVAKAVPHEVKDCHIVRGMKENRRQRLTVSIKEYAELYHLSRLSQHNEHDGGEFEPTFI